MNFDNNKTYHPWWTPGAAPVNTTQKSSRSARKASSRTISAAAADIWLEGEGVAKASKRFLTLGVRGDENPKGGVSLRSLCGVPGGRERMWWLDTWACWGVVGEDNTWGAAGRMGGVGYGLEPKDTATSIGRRPNLTNPSQAIWASSQELYPL